MDGFVDGLKRDSVTPLICVLSIDHDDRGSPRSMHGWMHIVHVTMCALMHQYFAYSTRHQYVSSVAGSAN